ncbi:MAG TPA: GAF domain-containing protein, partial [Bacteroidales bacterium]|nr:GAF domain-containing protein [Bacteroidales bacterium]
ENLKTLKNNNRLERKAKIALDDFSAVLANFESGINNLILITNERGSKDKGIVSHWLKLSRNMLDATASNADIRNKLNQISLLESEYLLNRDVKILQDISVLAEEIRNSLTPEDEGIAVNDIDSYIVYTGNLASIEKRMGHNDVQGIIPELEASINQLTVAFAALNARIVVLVKNNILFWDIVRWLVTLIMVSLFVTAFIKFFALIDPLKKVADYTARLSKGEFPDDKLKAGNHADMKVVIDSLQKHVGSLKDKLNFTRALNQDNFDQTLTVSGEKDELGNDLIMLQQKILENNKKQARNEEDNMVRRYMNEGLAKFADILRTKNSGINMLGDAFIREIVKYLNALQGGLFIHEESDTQEPVLKLISTFAYNRKKYLQQTIKIGEGLIGSCAKEKHYMNLTEIPDGYITITSGLGDTPPKNLLLVPVLHENEILGVVEIASLNKFRNHEIDFAQEVAYSLGSTLVTTRNNLRTTELLEKSQKQALEMAEQEEEMRQNMEELKATQEESARREEELRGIAEALDRTLMVIEYTIEGRIHNVNENVCRFLGREQNELIGKSHHEIFGGSLDTDVAFWNELQQNGHLTISETIKIGKKSFEISEHFARVTNRNNATVKFINFASNGRIGNS